MDFEQLINLGLSKKYLSHKDLKFFQLEDFLNRLNKESGYLFHGSGTLIPLDEKLISKRGVLHATDDGGIAIIKALFPNNLPGQTNLGYRLDKSGSQEVTITGKLGGEAIRQRGYIYILESNGFSNKNTQGIAEYIKPLQQNE